MAKKIFISPSDQIKNTYAYGNTTEAIQCNRIAEALSTALKRCGFETRVMHKYEMSVKVQNANNWGADLYIPIHTNACNGKVGGTRIFSYDNTGAGHRAALCVYKHLAPLTPGTSESVTAYPDLYEVNKPHAPTVYCECEFHDVPAYAKWIIEHVTDIAEAICQGVCEYFGVTYKKPASSTPKPTEEPKTGITMYKVQVGAFSVRANAEKKLAEVKKYFPDAFITTSK